MTTAALIKRPVTPLLPEGVYDFQRWLRRASRGSRIVYFVGHLMADRDHDKEADAVAARAMAASEAGEVRLFQRKVEEGRFRYIAVKR